MTNQTALASTDTRRAVRSIEVDAGDFARVANGIDALYSEAVDVIVVRRAFDGATLAAAGQALDSGVGSVAWSRPNEKMPVEDLQLLGTDSPATPTFQAPRGVALDDYLASAASHAGEAAAVFAPGFDAARQVHDVLSRLAGGRPVAVPQAADGRPYVPFTIRRLVDGKQIGVHHDYHYGLDLYRQLAPQVDTRTLISYVATLRAPLAGGELFVYGATANAPDLPRMPNGFAYDLDAIEARYDRARFVMHPGDLFLLASGRLLHRVGRIVGPQARITMGGFLALGQQHDRVLYWS